MRKPNYDKFPFIEVPGTAADCSAGWAAIGHCLRTAVAARGAAKTVLAVECYPGVDEAELRQVLSTELQPVTFILTADALRPEAEIERLCEPFLGGDDPVFGFLCGLTLPQFFDREKLAAAAQIVRNTAVGLVVILGCGATLVAEPDLLIYADLARWEIQQRQRHRGLSNLGVSHPNATPGAKYKRAFFIDWRVADRWKKALLGRADWFLDTNQPSAPKLASGAAVRCGLGTATGRPFRVVPFFDPGVWGGQWLKEVCGLDPARVNYAWCFDCVPEENSLLLGFGEHRFELPALDLVLAEPRALLGEAVHARFGTEFPIRFDLLDTMGGGNLSFQVHPLTEYIQQHFGMHYTQDESYYMLDAGPEAEVYLGLKDHVEPAAMVADLAAAARGEQAFPDERYVNRLPARKHDHFLIPAGTVHCSGADSLVLEISATPYIFTFKMWDWGRLDLNGQPRPLHLAHGAANIQWDRTTEWTRRNLVNRIEPLGTGDGWREERTGLHEREFIETRRHWFTGSVPHDTGGGVQVLNLVAGEEVVVESPTGAFAPVVIHYAETFIVPAAVGRFTIRPHGPSVGQECATLKAFVRS